MDKCCVCDYVIGSDGYNSGNCTYNYSCPRCGLVYVSREAVESIGRLTSQEKVKLSTCFRNEWEQNGRKSIRTLVKSPDVLEYIKQCSFMMPLAKIDNALINIYRSTQFVGDKVKITFDEDYPYFYCCHREELVGILEALSSELLIIDNGPPSQGYKCYTLTTKGFLRIESINKPSRQSNKCFVAMWFAPEMKNVYELAIKPAIEFVDPGEIAPRFEAVKIDDVQHVNDINDEIIAQIRRSRFMVCDLTGYRGGVYFEAGFAYGLGLDVIYTCRKDWAVQCNLFDKKRQVIDVLYDDEGSPVLVRKEGVHFDLAHRNRIEWEPGDLLGLKNKLENRIKAVIG